MTDQDKPRHREWTVSYKKGFGPWINRWPSDFEANEEERVRLVEYSALLEEREKVKGLMENLRIAEIALREIRQNSLLMKGPSFMTQQEKMALMAREALELIKKYGDA